MQPSSVKPTSIVTFLDLSYDFQTATPHWLLVDFDHDHNRSNKFAQQSIPTLYRSRTIKKTLLIRKAELWHISIPPLTSAIVADSDAALQSIIYEDGSSRGIRSTLED